MTDEDLVPLADLVGIFHRSKATLYRWADTGAIPTRRIGGSVYMHRDDVQRLTAPIDRITAELDARKAEHGVILPAADMALLINALQDALTTLRHARRSDKRG